MAKLIWSVLCKRGILDKRTNNVSLIDALENLEFRSSDPIEEEKQWKLLPIEITLVSFITRTDYNEPERSKLRIQIASPDGRIHKKSIITDVNLIEHQRFRNFAMMRQVAFWASGIHKFVVSLQGENDKWTKSAEIPLDIRQKESTTKGGVEG